mgnify:CR=1 FL=1
MKKLLFLLISLFFIVSCSYVDEIKSDITGQTVTQDDLNDQSIKLDSGKIDVYFCPRDNCRDKLNNLVKSSQKINCAFYELNLNDLITSLKEKNSLIVVDNDNYEEINANLDVKQDDRSALMHNKFCIFDNKIVSTGSFNPTVSANTKQNNNLVMISSESLAENYNDEFQSFLGKRFGNDEKVKYPKIILNNEILIENYFCPEDDCEQHVYDVISKAKKRIYFMTFSFTSDKIGDLIIKKSNITEVKGIFEKTQATTEYSEYNKMKDANLNVILDKNPSFMHHKVFIVDDIVILGSYNPTSSGNNNNDENIVIIYDIPVSDKFLEEFDYVWNL